MSSVSSTFYAAFAAISFTCIHGVDAGNIDDFLFRYDFSSGSKVYHHNNLEAEPAGLWSGFTAVNGTDGYGSAVHPCGKGTIENGFEILNADWTLAMSVKSCQVEKGVLLSLGSIGTFSSANALQELLICSSAKPGQMHLGVAQRWGSNGDYKNVPVSLDITGLGDTFGSFHSLVITYTHSETLLRMYWDGEYKGGINTRHAMSTGRFNDGFQFCSSHGGLWTNSPYKPTSGNLDVAFRDVRLFTRVLGEEDIAEYVSAHPVKPAAVSSISDYMFRHKFTSGKLEVEGSGFIDHGMEGTGTPVEDPSGYGTATFPDNTGYGEVEGGLEGDWTAAMTFRSSATVDDAILFCLGGTSEGGKRGLVLRTSTNKDQLKMSTVQNWGGGVNTSNNGTLSNLVDTSADFHTLVVVHAQGLKEVQGTGESGSTSDGGEMQKTWVAGGFSFYWDGVWVGSLSTWNGAGDKRIMNAFKYGAIYNNAISGYKELTDATSGVAFRDFRFIPKIWTSAEANEYTKSSSPLKDFLFRYDFTSGDKIYSNNGHESEPVGEWSGYTPVNGPNGYGSAVHPCGVGTIADGENVLNNGDWSVAMSVRPGSKERGLFLGIGGTRCASTGRELCFLSTSTPGKIRIVSRQTYSWGGGLYYNEPAGLDIGDIGDTANTFHTIVATCAKYDSEKGIAAVNVYVDGILKASFDADSAMTQKFRSSLMFSAAFENTGGTGWDGSKIPYSDVSCTMDTAFQDLRFFTRIITSDEIAGYAALYPAAGSAVMDIGDYSFRHDFSSGALAVDGDGYSDDSNSPMSGKGTRVLGAKNGSKYATFPDSTGFGMIKSGLNCDWTCAMSVKPGSVNADYGVLLGLGGIRDAGKRVMTICSTPNAGELFVSIPQKYGSGNGESNITSNKGTISGLGNTKDEFHTLVIVHAHGQRTHKSTIDGKAYTGDVGNPNASGVFTFYWDGEFAGTLATGDGATRPFMDMIQYGAIYNEKPAQGGDKYHTLTDVSCGTAFQDLRFIPKAWGTAEADAYAKAFPVSRQARPGFRLVLQ